MPITNGSYRLAITALDASNNFIKSNMVNVQIGNITAPIITSSVSASLSDASADKAGTNFGPGLGIPNAVQNKNGNDWHWRVMVKADANTKKNISSITINHSGTNEAWSTSESRYYPLVVFKGGTQVNTTYGNIIDISSTGENTLDLYGQPETTPFYGGTITVKFGDGSSVNSSIPASNIKQVTVSAQTGTTAAIWDAIREYYQNGGQ